MTFRDNLRRYGWLSVSLHWVTLLLLALVYACIELRELFPKGSDWRELLQNWHYTLGLSVLILTFLRLVLHLGATTPRIEPTPPPWQQFLGKWMHVALYALMLGMPLAGWLALSAAGDQIPFFGLQLPALIGESRNTAEWVKEIHESGGQIGYFLIGIHAAAALFHHYVMRDNTLRRMLPGKD